MTPSIDNDVHCFFIRLNLKIPDDILNLLLYSDFYSRQLAKALRCSYLLSGGATWRKHCVARIVFVVAPPGESTVLLVSYSSWRQLATASLILTRSVLDNRNLLSRLLLFINNIITGLPKCASDTKLVSASRQIETSKRSN